MENLTFEKLPVAMAMLLNKVANLESLIKNQVAQAASDPDRWLTIDELCDYLPGKPARATIYGKVHHRNIPHKKFGKRLAFLKSEIDHWLKSQSRKTVSEIQEEADHYLNKKKGGKGHV